MNNLHRVVALLLLPAACGATTFQANDADSGPWAKILGAVGITETRDKPGILIAGPDARIDAAGAAENQILILEGTGAAAKSLGFVTKPGTVSLRQIRDEHAPRMQIIWEQPVSVLEVDVPTGFQVFAAEKWKGIPVLAGKRTAHGAILWLATTPGATGIERYPYLLQALVDL